MKNLQSLSTAELRRMVANNEIDRASFDREIQEREDEHRDIRANEHEMNLWHPMRGELTSREEFGKGCW